MSENVKNEKKKNSNKNTSTSQVPSIKMEYKKATILVSIVFFIVSILLRDKTSEIPFVQSIIDFAAEATGVFSASIIMASIAWLSDISEIFKKGIDATKDSIMEEINLLKEKIDCTTDVDRFPIEKLNENQLRQLTEKAVHASWKLTNPEKDPTGDSVLQEMKKYYSDIVGEIQRGVVYKYYSRMIEVEPKSNGEITVTIRLEYSLNILGKPENVKVSHQPIFPSLKYAESLRYKTILLDGNELLLDNEFKAQTKCIYEFGDSTKRYKYDWEKPIVEPGVHTFHVELTMDCPETIYIHSAVLTYPCSDLRIICKVIGTEKDKWKIDADAYYAKGHSLDKNHEKDVLKSAFGGGENGICLYQNVERTPCLLDGTAYKIVVYPKK